MKTYKPLQLILLLLTILNLTGCMPDSFTKFEEDPPVSSQGAGAGAAATPTPLPTEPPENLSYGLGGSGDRVGSLTVGTAVVDLAPTAVEGGAVTSYSIAPPLPAGLSFNTATGEITGTPTVYAPTTTYIVTASNSAGSATANIIVAILTPPTGLRVHGSPQVKLTVIDASAFFIGGSVASQGGGIGTVNSIEGNQITVTVVSGTFSNVAPLNNLDNAATYVAAATVIDEVDYTVRQKIKLASTAGFTAGGLISSSLGHFGVVLEIINATELTVGICFGSFNPQDIVDNTYPYVAQADQITEISFVYEPDQEIDLFPILSAGEEIEYHIVPDDILPEGFDVFDPGFGYVAGVQQGSALYAFTLQAENEVGTLNVPFTVGPEESFPQHISYAQGLILNVSDTSAFKKGDEISSDVAGGGGSAIILRKIDGNNLYVKLQYGYFNQSHGIDNVFPYGGEKAIVNSVLPVTAVLYVGDGQGAAFGRKGFISSAGNVAQGIVAYVDPYDGVNDVIYAFAYKGSFIVGDATTLTLDNEQSYVAAAATVSHIEAPNMRYRVNAITNFAKGSQITDAIGSAGHVMDIDAGNLDLFVEIINQGFTFNNAADDIDNFNPYAAVETDITEMAPDNTFYLYRDVPVRLHSFLRKGSSPVWTIAPALPEGLDISPSTGHIEGTPVKSSSKKIYVVTATNLIDGIQYTETYSFYLQVLDHFTISNETPSATSYILHKEGRKNGSSSCTITRDQIQGTDLSVKDIVCRLEAEEQDAYQHGITLQVNSSAGLCQFVKHTPYTFMSRPTSRTTSHTVVRTANALANGADCVLPPVDTVDGGGFCISDYSFQPAHAVNCDRGSYITRQITWSDNTPGVPCATAALVEDQLQTCDGNAKSCKQGAVANMVINSTTFEYDKFEFVSSPSSEGLILQYQYVSPMEDLTFGDQRKLVNYVGNNSCAEAAAGTAKGYLYGAANWDLYPLNGVTATPTYPANQPPQKIGTFVGTATFGPGLTHASTQTARATINTVGDYRNSIRVGDRIVVDWAHAGGMVGGLGRHVVADITATTITFVRPVEFIPYADGVTVYNIYHDLYSDPFKGEFVSPYYVFECKDAAQDTIARIRVQVRDWDRRFTEEDDIDLLSSAVTGTVSSTAAASGLTGVGTLFSTELAVDQMFRFGNQVNQVSSITNDTNLVMVENADSTAAAQVLYKRPPLMDTGDATDLFLQTYNDYFDWDDRNSVLDLTTFRGTYTHLNSCDVGAPFLGPNDRAFFFDFLEGGYKTQ